MNLIILLPLLMQALPTIQKILSGASNNQAITANIQQQMPQDIVAALAQIGMPKLFATADSSIASRIRRCSGWAACHRFGWRGG